MFGFDEAREQRDDLYENNPHQAKLSHEVVAGGVAFEAMKKWEDSQRKKGDVVNHGFAKEALMGFAAVEMDKWAESKGMDKVSKERAQHQAQEKAEQLYNEQYGDQSQYDPSSSRRHQSMDY